MTNSLERAPFNDNGNLMSYVPGYVTPDWRPNDPFMATLTLVGVERGQSSAVFTWKCARTGARFPMFVSDLAGLLQRHGVGQGGVVCARWQVRKRGANYGLALAE